MQNKDKGDGIEDSPLDMLLVILLDGASKEVVMPSSETLSFVIIGVAVVEDWSWINSWSFWLGLKLGESGLW